MKTGMGTLLALAGLMIWPAATPAQDENEERRARGIERQVEGMKRLLELDAEQVEKLTEILTRSSENEAKAREERTKKINEVLTEEQRKKLEESRSNRGRRGRRGGEGGEEQGRRGNRGGFGFSAEGLKEPLGLDDEQVEKIDEIYSESRDKMREFFEEQRESGERMDREAMREAMEKMRTETTEAINGVLTDEQKEKYKKYLEERQNRFGNRGRRERGTPTESRQSVEQLVKTGMDLLKIEDEDEKSIIEELLKKAVEASRTLTTYNKDTRGKVGEYLDDKSLSDDDLEEKLGQIRTKRSDLQKAVKGAQKELREVLSFRQELILVKAGLLE